MYVYMYVCRLYRKRAKREERKCHFIYYLHLGKSWLPSKHDIRSSLLSS